MTSVRQISRRAIVALMATLAMVTAGLSAASPASASGTTYARFDTGYPNTYARIVWYEGSSIHTNGRKLFSASCSYGCDPEGWGEMVMQSGDVFRLWVDSGTSDSHSFYSPVAKFRFCVLDDRCTPWKTN